MATLFLSTYTHTHSNIHWSFLCHSALLTMSSTALSHRSTCCSLNLCCVCFLAAGVCGVNQQCHSSLSRSPAVCFCALSCCLGVATAGTMGNIHRQRCEWRGWLHIHCMYSHTSTHTHTVAASSKLSDVRPSNLTSLVSRLAWQSLSKLSLLVS